MSSIKIITDSASDLPKDIIEEYDIDVLPLLVIEGEKEYRDYETLMPQELFKKMKEGVSFTTSQVATSDYYRKFEKYIIDGRECIYIAFSSNLSGCYQGSLLALEQLKEKYSDDKVKIHVYDTKCASLGFGLVVLKAAKMAKEEKELKEILKAVEFYSKNMEHIFTVFDLDYLHRGGRLKKSAAVIGNLLNLYPILNVEDGNLHVIETVRGRKKHYKKIINFIENRGIDLENQTIGIVYGDDAEIVVEIKNFFKEKYNTENFITREVGSVIGAHTGPEMYSIFFLKAKDPF
ncbi:MAG: DegV family protein [Eubacteriaceae bacterium]